MSLCATWANAIFQFQSTPTPAQEQAPSIAEKLNSLPNSEIAGKKLKSSLFTNR